MTTTIVPLQNDISDSKSAASVISRHATALEICDIVYGNSNPTWEAIEHYYESSAISTDQIRVLPQVYENPFVTASSRLILADISSLTRRLSQFDIPKPVAMLHTLFRLEHSSKGSEPWFRALEVWTEVDEILESDSFDGHHRTIVEHTLHILFLPGLHADKAVRSCGLTLVASDSDEQYPQLSLTGSAGLPRPEEPVLAFAGIGLPSPLHFQLHIMTRLSLNEQGRIIHHRDFWDVKDLFGLLPGATLTQWISTRLTGYALAGVSRIFSRIIGKREAEEEESGPEIVRKGGERIHSNSEPTTQAAAYARHIQMHGHIPSSRG